MSIRRESTTVKMPMKFGISQEISAPLASLVQHTGTRASKIAPRPAISSCVMSTVPSALKSPEAEGV
jgi:hypothetical protein